MKRLSRLKRSRRSLACDETPPFYISHLHSVFKGGRYYWTMRIRNDTCRKSFCQDTEIICGFPVIKIPPKPDYVPITQEEFQQEVISAWTRGGYMEKTAAVFRGGIREWAALWNDDNVNIRGAVACRAGEEYQLKLVNDPVSAVRKMLAVYGTDKVRLALLERGEPDEDVLINIAKYGSLAIRNRLVETVWINPELLFKLGRFLPPSGIEKLLAHPQIDVRIMAAVHGTCDQCRRVLAMPYSRHDITVVFMRDSLIEHMEELDAVASAINFDKTKSRKFENMEL